MQNFTYLQSITNLKKILYRIREAGAPPRFTHEFLKTSLGFKGSNDRGIIAVLKQLKFLDGDGVPTDRYHKFRSGTTGGDVLAEGLLEGWSEIFLADQQANTKNASQLKEFFKTVTGKSESVAEKMASTFKSLCDNASWGTSNTKSQTPETNHSEINESNDQHEKTNNSSGLTLRHDVHVHLPPSSDVAVYKAIFRALRDELLD